jgi:hypothetical protein
MLEVECRQSYGDTYQLTVLAMYKSGPELPML